METSKKNIDCYTWKKEKNTLGLPDFDDKIFQGTVLIILEAANKAQFEKFHWAFSFRPYKDTNGALEKRKMETKFYQWAVEGHIKGA